MLSRLAMAGTALLATFALVSCSNVTDGEPACPGCGTHAEPEFPTTRPSVTPPTTPTPEPGPTATAAPPSGAETLPANEQGYVFVQTKSGKTRCQLNTEAVGCESQFENSPDVDGHPANGVNVTSDGSVRWILGNLGNIPAVTLDYRDYTAQGWDIAASAEGTRFTNRSTGHGMFVAVEGVETF